MKYLVFILVIAGLVSSTSAYAHRKAAYTHVKKSHAFPYQVGR